MKHAHAKERKTFKNFFHRLYLSYIPNGRDNIKQIIIKVFFLISLITLIVSASYLANYFLSAKKQDNIIKSSRNIWHGTVSTDSSAQKLTVNEYMLRENSDFKGWITVPNTRVDNPIYQTADNSFYLTHNQKKQKSAYGALFFDCENKITEEETDKNLVIYGHHMKNGSMFADLTKYRSLSFYRQNPTFEFSTLYKKSTYKVYAVFVLNASKSDDNNYIYNISRKSFANDEDFESWSGEAYERSLINTGVDVNKDDNIITLVTCVYDFDDARLVVMARETREDEEASVDTSAAKANPSPRYPKRWYDDRGIKYPFE